MTQRIEPFLKCDSKNWTFWIRLNELNPFLKKKELKELNLSGMWLKELSLFFPNVTHRIEPLFMTQRIEPFFFEDDSKIRLKELNLFSIWLDSKNRTLFFFNTTQKFELQKKNSKNWTFWTWLKELILREYDLQNWTLCWTWLKELNLLLFKEIWLKELNTFFQKWLKELNSSWYDSKNWTLFSIRLEELNLFFFNMTQRIDPFVLEYDAENWTFFLEHDAENWTFFSWIWLKELNFFYDCKLFEEKMSQRIEPFSVWLKELNFLVCLFLIRHTELNHDFTEYNTQNWTFFSHDSNFF